MQTRIVAVQIIDLGLLDRLYHVLRNELYVMVNTGQMLCGIEYHRCTGTQQRRGLGCYDSAVRQLYCGSRNAGLLLTLLGGNRTAAGSRGYAGLVHEQRNLVDLGLAVLAACHITQGSIVTAYHLILGGTAANIVIADAESCHVHTHVGG